MDGLVGDRAYNVSLRKCFAQAFTRTCSLQSAHNTCVQSRAFHSWSDKSYGLSWVAVHSMDNSVCVVARRADLDTACVRLGHKASQKSEVMDGLTKAIVSEVEVYPYHLFDRFGLIIKKPFGVVSVCPAVGKSGEEEPKCVKYDAIDFLTGKVKESVITVDDAIKTAISAYKCLCPQELKAADYLVTALDGSSTKAEHFTVRENEKLSADINSGCATAIKIDEQFSVMKIDFGRYEQINM